MMDNLHIVQWNAARSTAATNYLLSTLINNPKPPQAILIQEPPWYQIGLEPSPTDPNGIPKMGVPAFPGYAAVLPPSAPATRPRVVTYISRAIPTSQWSIVSAASSGSDVLTIEIRSDNTVRLCNFYGQQPPDGAVRQPLYPGESFLLTLAPELAASLTIAGDFN